MPKPKGRKRHSSKSKYDRHRQLKPGKFQKSTFKTVPLSHTDYNGKFRNKKGAKAIVGKKKGTGKWTIQSILIPKKR